MPIEQARTFAMDVVHTQSRDADDPVLILAKEYLEATAPKAELAEPLLPDGFEWACVEVFGHRQHFGRAREEERFGSKLLRIDIPKKGDPATEGWKTHYYGGSAIFSYTLTDEVTVMKANKPYSPPSLAIAGPDHEDDPDLPF